MKMLSKLVLGFAAISLIASSCSKDEEDTNPNSSNGGNNNNSNGLEITTTDTLDEASRIWIRVDGGTPPYEIDYTAMNPTADNDLIIVEVQVPDGDVTLDYGYKFERSSDRTLSPGTYEFTVTDADGNTDTKTVINKGFIIQYDPTNILMYDGYVLDWNGYSGDVSPYNNFQFSMSIGEDSYFDYNYPRIAIDAWDALLQDGVNDFPSALIGSAPSNQLQVQLDLVSNNEWSTSYNTNNVSDQTGSMSIQMDADDATGHGLDYLRIEFNSVKLSGWDSSSSSNVETLLNGVVFAIYYEG